MEVRKNHVQAAARTVEELRTIAQSLDMRELTELNLPAIEEVDELVQQLKPAGSATGVIRNGLARLPSRRTSFEYTRKEASAFTRLVENLKDQAVYFTFFVTPAACLSLYQKGLKLLGHTPEEDFPEGYWQFYVNYALREDTARHANETHGFDTILKRHNITLSPVDRMTSWVMAVIYCLHQYNELLQNEWRERVYTEALRTLTKQLPDRAHYARLYRQWERQRPYRRGVDVRPGQDYPTYRSMKFDEFLEKQMQKLPIKIKDEWVYAVREAKKNELPTYQQQMSILAYLQSEVYEEVRKPIPLASTQVGVICKGHYYLIPVCHPQTGKPSDVTFVRSQVDAIFKQEPAEKAISLIDWAKTQRGYIPQLRQQLRPEVLAEIDQLHYTPILLSFDRQEYYANLSLLRDTERGTGTHAMTILQTGESFIFDQSHIFFDGTWGAAIAEIITNEATAWGVYLNTLPPIHIQTPPPHRLRFQLTPQEQELIHQATKVPVEASAETDAVNLGNLVALRRFFKLRSDLIQLTVNDLLVVYRAIHAYTYRPEPFIAQELARLLEDKRTAPAAKAALKLLDPQNATNPAVLIPIDASQQNPRDRLHPLNFQVPLHELNLLGLHQEVMLALNEYKKIDDPNQRDLAYQSFDKIQRQYLAALAGCGVVFARAKEIAAMGESASVGTIKLLAHLPVPIQRFLDKIPSRFEVLNDIIKGREVFSNVGAVAPNSSLLRFTSAKDDNEDKTLIWGVLTDTESVMRITLRDFRPHVRLLYEIGRMDLAVRMTHDYLNAYANGLNEYVRDLRRITMASRETRHTSELGFLDV